MLASYDPRRYGTVKFDGVRGGSVVGVFLNSIQALRESFDALLGIDSNQIDRSRVFYSELTNAMKRVL